MEYVVNNYYQNKEDGRVIRFIGKNIADNSYRFLDLSTMEEKIIRIENPFMPLGLTICRISELRGENNKGKNIFKSFIKGINLNSSYELNLINQKYYLQQTYAVNEDASVNDTDFVEDNINEFFIRIESLKSEVFQLPIEQKDNFLIEQFK